MGLYELRGVILPPSAPLGDLVIDRALTEAVTYRVAVLALTSSAGTAPDDAERRESDVRWCLEPLDGEITDTVAATLAALTSETIADPTMNRQRFVDALTAISE